MVGVVEVSGSVAVSGWLRLGRRRFARRQDRIELRSIQGQDRVVADVVLALSVYVVCGHCPVRGDGPLLTLVDR